MPPKKSKAGKVERAAKASAEAKRKRDAAAQRELSHPFA